MHSVLLIRQDVLLLARVVLPKKIHVPGILVLQPLVLDILEQTDFVKDPTILLSRPALPRSVQMLLLLFQLMQPASYIN